MGDSGERLGADLYRLLRVADGHLPTVAAVYQDAAANLEAAGAPAERLFRRPGALGGGTSAAWEPWIELHTTVLRCLRDTGAALDDASQALRIAVDAYRAADDGARMTLQEFLDRDGEPKPQPRVDG
ncbi:hypothetical protein [Dactylosporangium sp. CA-233914]|uniref:hypothetical protein n=1 Tax=Dactylosporangium sp. CA-233914 TaxID=3239934 RepID=UPI003D94FD2D